MPKKVDGKLMDEIILLGKNLELNIPYYKSDERMMRIFQDVLYNKYVENDEPLNNYFMIYTTIEENIIKINIAFIDTYSEEDYLDESQIKILSNLKVKQVEQVEQIKTILEYIKTILEYIKKFEGNFLTKDELIEIKNFKGEDFSTFSTDKELIKTETELIKNLKTKVLDDLNEEQIEILSKLRNCINEPKPKSNLSGGYKFKKYKKRKLSKKNKKYKKRNISKKRNKSKKRNISKKRKLSKKKK